MSLLKRIERSQQPDEGEAKSGGASNPIRPRVSDQQTRRSAPTASHARDAFKDLKERIQD